MIPIFNHKGLIVSCQALPGEPLYGGHMMVNMAVAAQQGGAVGIRANGIDDIFHIKQNVSVPVIGLIKRHLAGSSIFITPTLDEVKTIVDVGADIVAMDMTLRENRQEQVREMIEYIHNAGVGVMADISTVEEGIHAEQSGADFVSTTLSGYTPYSPQTVEPDLELVAKLSQVIRLPVIAEGRIWRPADARKAVEMGASYVVVGSAITRPQLITQKFVSYLFGSQN